MPIKSDKKWRCVPINLGVSIFCIFTFGLFANAGCGKLSFCSLSILMFFVLTNFEISNGDAKYQKYLSVTNFQTTKIYITEKVPDKKVSKNAKKKPFRRRGKLLKKSVLKSEHDKKNKVDYKILYFDLMKI
jgi:hypothetical protein